MPWPCPLERGEGEGEVRAVKKRGVRTQGHIVLYHARVFSS